MKLLGMNLWGSSKKDSPLPLNSAITPIGISTNNRLLASQVYTGWVAKCVKAISEEVGRMELTLYKRVGTKIEAVNEHPVLDLLKYVNEFFTGYQLFERLQSNLELYGNEYWYVERKSKNGPPVRIYPLRPDAVTPKKGKFYVEYYAYNYNGQAFNLGLDDVVHFKTFNPNSDIVGLSTIETARVTIETDYFSKEYTKKFYQNDATPAGVLSIQDEVDQDKADQIRNKWNEMFSGWRRAFKVAVLSGGVKYESISSKHSDMQYVEQSKMNRDDILAMFGVPKTVIGVVEDVNFASAKAANYVFSSRCIYPKEQRIADQLTEFLLPMFGVDDMWFEVKSPVQEDKLESAQVNQIKFTNGQLSINEWRKQDGLPPVENGDQVFLPFSLTPFTSVTKVKSLPVEHNTKLYEKVEETVLATLQVLKPETCNHQGEDKDCYTKEVSDISRKDNQRFQMRMDANSFEDLGQKINSQMKLREDPYIRKMESVMTNIFTEQREEAINSMRDYVRTLAKSKKARKAKLPEFLNIPEQVKITIDLVTPIMSDLINSEGQVAFANLGLRAEDFSIDAPNVRKYLQESVKKFANEVTQHTSNIIRQQIADGLDSGEGIAALTTRIRDIAGLTHTRAELIAVTEVHRTQGHAEIEAWAQSDVVDAKIWYTALDERVCPECSLMHGKEVDLGSPFLSVSGIRDMGYENYDGALEIAQMHPRCRCSIIPVIKGQP